jgi:hypothetical protein
MGAAFAKSVSLLTNFSSSPRASSLIRSIATSREEPFVANCHGLYHGPN